MGKSLLSMWGLPEPIKELDRIIPEPESSQTEPDSETGPFSDVSEMPMHPPEPAKPPVHPFFAQKPKQSSDPVETGAKTVPKEAEQDSQVVEPSTDLTSLSFPVVLKLPKQATPKIHSFFAPRTKKTLSKPDLIEVETPHSSFERPDRAQNIHQTNQPDQEAQESGQENSQESNQGPNQEPNQIKRLKLSNSSGESQLAGQSPETVPTGSLPDQQTVACLTASSKKLGEAEGVKVEEKPTFHVCLKVAPEKLREIKSKVHSFFTKRQVSAPTRNPEEVAPPMPVQNACWPKFHVRGERMPESKPYEKRKPTDDYDDVFFVGTLLPLSMPPIKKKARRLPVTREEAVEISEKGLGPAKLAEQDPLFTSLMSRVGDKNAFDLGEYEQQLWALKYAPCTSEACINAKAAFETRKWIKNKIAELRQGRPLPRRRPTYADGLDDFIVDDDEENTRLPDYLILHGPSGTGKTASAYAAAKELGAFIFEVNSSQKRGGKELQSLLDGIGQSHSVHGSKSTADGRPSSPWAPDAKAEAVKKASAKNRDCVVLIEDIDTLYESEAVSFYAALDKLALGSRRPIVLTCQDLERLPYSVTDQANVIDVRPADPVRVVDAAWQIALCEGHSLDKTEVAATAVRYGCDFRKLLNHLQFWSQMGVGGRPSGSDWVFKSYEEDKYHRVLSIGTPVIPPPLPGTRLAAEPQTLDSICDAAETLSQLVSHEGRLPNTFSSRARPEETIAGYVAAQEWGEIEAPERYAAEYLRDIPQRSLQPLRYALDGVHDSRSLAVDVAPYARDMARSDLQRLKIMQGYGFRRATRRTWVSVGVDSRQYTSNGSEILQLGPVFSS